MAKKRRSTAFWIGAIGIVLLIVIGIVLQNLKALGVGGIGFLIIWVIFSILPDLIKNKVDKIFKEMKRAIRGAKAEDRIGEILSELSPEFYILHDIKSLYSNIDHIVISKDTGIFLIETKAHGGKVSLDGNILKVNGKLPEKDFIAQTLRNSYWLRDEIGRFLGSKPWITQILVFTNAFVPPTKPVNGVNIMNKKYLSIFLQRESKPNIINTRVWEQKEKIGMSLQIGEYDNHKNFLPVNKG